MLDDNPLAKQRLFWTLLLFKFKRLEITREEAKLVLDFYNDMRGGISNLIERVSLT